VSDTEDVTWELGHGMSATINLGVRGVIIYGYDNVVTLNEFQLNRLQLLLHCLPDIRSQKEIK
jgi:hypothetical protein